MMRSLFILLIFLGLCSCTKNEQNSIEGSQDAKATVNQNHKISSSIAEVLSPEARKQIESWKEYKNLELIIEEYYNTTTDKALISASSLVKATQELKDSIRVEKFKSNDIKIRLNVLYNNALNIEQLNSKAKKDPEVIKNEIANTLAAFSALNSKLNSVIKQESLEEELKEFNN